MIYRIYRKDPNVRAQTQMNKPLTSQSLFIEQISRVIKLIKKKEDLFIRLLQESSKGQAMNLSYPHNYNKQYQNYIEEEKSIISTLLTFSKEGFFSSNTYLYTVFMRVQELFDISKKMFQIKGRRDIESTYENVKRSVAQIYHNQTYQQNYSVMEIIEFVTKNQNARIVKFFPKKRTAKLVPVSILQKLKQSNINLNGFMRKTISVQFFKGNTINLDEVVNKKLVVKQQSTHKRFSQQKTGKNKKTNLFKLYNIPDMRSMQIEKLSALNSYELEMSMNQRNQKIKEQIKKWQKKYFLFSCLRKKKQW